MSLVSDLLNVGGQYYLGTSGADDARAAGQSAVAMGEAAGQSAIDRSSFEPYTVTSNLATGKTNAQGGLDLSLSPEEQRRQNARFRQAESIYGAIGADPRRMASEYYESIRAAQRPEEERNRLDMQQGLFSSGRGGISSAQYGGTPEQLAFEKARAEAQLGASSLARTNALAERDQQLKAAGLLTDQAYQGQREAIDLFGAAATPAQLAATGARTGAELAAQSEQSGIEGMLQGEELANLLERAAISGALPALTGSYDAETGQYTGGIVGGLGGLFGEGGLLGALGLGGLFGGGGQPTGGYTGNIFSNGTSGGNSGASQAGAYTGEFGTGGPGNVVVDATNYLDDDYNILDDQ
tara:strand:- start:1971 stop:3029 length:1059 start_codon:yes stop_codon:yes gene_type:complete